MPPLRGELRISILENVVGVQDVRKGDQKLISNLERLLIKWEPESNDDDSAENVLDLLQPNVDLENLCIQGYSAQRFPRWVNDIAKFDKIVALSLVDCKKYKSLPCLGLLSSLEDLYIQRMDGVEGVGPEFCGRSQGCDCRILPCFKALEFLSFEDMPNWEEWSSSLSSFPRLRQLEIRNCPKLIKKLPACLPSLKELWITKSPNFESPLLGLPSLHQLDVEVLRSSGSDLTSLTRLTVSGISGLINLQQGFVGFLGALQDLRISGCPEMISPWEDEFGLENLHDRLGSGGRDGHELESLGLGLGLGCNLKALEIEKCERLERLPNRWHLVLTCLEKLSISKCPKLVSFPDGFPPVLRDVTIVSCAGLKHLPDGMMMITTRSNNNSSCRLECLNIRWCPSLSCFPKGQLPATLKKLTLWRCETLDCLPDGMMCSNNTSTGAEDHDICCSQLEELEIGFCPCLSCFPNGSLPTTLKRLRIHNCRKLDSLPQGIMLHHHHHHQYSIKYPSLEILRLEGCSSLTSFPQGTFPSTLRELELSHNPQLESISGEIMFHHNCSLQRLSIWDNPNLRTLPADCLYNLTSLSIIDCGNLEIEHSQFKNLTRLTCWIINPTLSLYVK